MSLLASSAADAAAAAAPASVVVLGALLGCSTALLCAAVLRQLVLRRCGGPRLPAAPPPVRSRRERATQQLEKMRHASGAAASPSTPPLDVPENTTAEVDGEGSDEESWESTGSGSSDEEESEETDSEYEEMEALQLKIVFVVRNTVQPKITAQEVAVLTASAGVELMELQNHEGGQQAARDAGSPSRTLPASASVTAEERTRWRRWYLWWNRIGCAKIALKCPDADTMHALVTAAEEARLPMALLRREDAIPAAPAGAVQAPSTPGEVVIVSIGPAPAEVLKPITGALKLFS